MKIKSSIFFPLLVLVPVMAWAHSGGTDASGGHYDSRSGEYHKHNSGRSYSGGGSDEEASSRSGWLSRRLNQNSEAEEIDNTPPTRTAVLVKQVVDGDTIIIDNYGIETRVRFRRFNAPEPDSTAGKKCENYLRELLEGQSVTLEHDNIRDRYGRLLVTVYFRTKNVSMQMKDFLREISTKH